MTKFVSVVIKPLNVGDYKSVSYLL